MEALAVRIRVRVRVRSCGRAVVRAGRCWCWCTDRLLLSFYLSWYKWVQERQAELDRVFDAHDTMVRSAVFVASVSNICQGSGGVPLGEIRVSPFV